MKYSYIYIIIIVVFGLLIFLGKIMEDNKEKQEKIYDLLDDCESAFDKGTDAETVKTCKKYLDELILAQEQLHDLSPDAGNTIEIKYVKALKEYLHDLEMEAWLKKSEKHLDGFLYNYEIIMDGEFDDFKNVDKLYSAMDKCLAEWHAYFAIDLTEYETCIYPKRYMREYADERYDPCMDDSLSLKKKLSEKIQKMRPEYVRKMHLLDQIVDYVKENPDIQRSILMNICFDGYTQKEVEICYRALIQERRLIEIKLGNRYYVSLTDGECNKQKSKNADKKESNRMDIVDYSKIDFINMLNENHIKFIDRMESGGCLWVEECEWMAQNWNKILVEGKQFKKADKAKSFGGNPAWYIK